MNERRERLLALLKASGARLHALLTRLTLRPDVAEDLLQELFLKLDRSSSLDQVGNLEGYAARTALRLAFDWRQRQRKLPLQALSTEPGVLAPSPLAQMIRREELEQVLDAMQNLPELSRVCLVLHYLQHWSNEAIAEELGKTPHQVRALCSKGIARLRQLIPVLEKTGDSHDDI